MCIDNTFDSLNIFKQSRNPGIPDSSLAAMLPWRIVRMSFGGVLAVSTTGGLDESNS
ncbi:hypothetical protein [Desulfovibrio sp. Huiquan2017]|uniref:hypothetical protein n=1 Tax=Desulfovibrio sp. Huiquan2017 TaxID=2816861 RepID=UPI001A925275|nr:hypothetical protein [Desulfovibrio sp. Huiquan2017]